MPQRGTCRPRCRTESRRDPTWNCKKKARSVSTSVAMVPGTRFRQVCLRPRFWPLGFLPMTSRLTLLVLFPSYGPSGVMAAVVVVADARSASGCSFCFIFRGNFGSYELECCDDDACLSSSFWPELVRPTARIATPDSSCDAIRCHFGTTLDSRAVWDTKCTCRRCICTIAWLLQIVE